MFNTVHVLRGGIGSPHGHVDGSVQGQSEAVQGKTALERQQQVWKHVVNVYTTRLT